MLSDTLTEGLEAYRIGPKIRELRRAKRLGLTQLGDHTGLSAGMLSKIERGQVFPTLPTLLKIALVFGVGLDHFFDEGAAPPVLEIVRARDRLRLPDRPDGPVSYYFESLDFPVSERQLESYLADFPAGAAMTRPHAHAGVELIYVMAGTLELSIHGKALRLGTGDSIYFEADHEHSYRCAGDENCRAMVVVGGAQG
jgi:transcriptional regulator with XRE-family HTH domain